MVGLAVAPKSRGDEAKLSGALHKITEEDATDPSRSRSRDQGDGAHRHERAASDADSGTAQARDKVEVETKEPKVPYRETIQSNADGSYRHKKQSGGAGQFAKCTFACILSRKGPTSKSTHQGPVSASQAPHYHEKSNFLWVDSVVGGSIPGNFMPAIEKGFLERLRQGVVAGYPVQNVCVEVHFGKDHPVDSNETAFKMAASKAFARCSRRPGRSAGADGQHAHHRAGDNVGDVSSDLSGRRGQMVGMEQPAAA